jgi:hypothetical protein
VGVGVGSTNGKWEGPGLKGRFPIAWAGEAQDEGGDKDLAGLKGRFQEETARIGLGNRGSPPQRGFWVAHGAYKFHVFHLPCCIQVAVP